MPTTTADAPPRTTGADAASPRLSAHPLQMLCASAMIEWEQAPRHGEPRFHLQERVTPQAGVLEGWTAFATVRPATPRNWKVWTWKRSRQEWRVWRRSSYFIPGKPRKDGGATRYWHMAVVNLFWGDEGVPPIVFVKPAGKPGWKTPAAAKTAVVDLLTGGDIGRLQVSEEYGEWTPASALPEMFPDPAELAKLAPCGHKARFGPGGEKTAWPPCSVCRKGIFSPLHRANANGHHYRPGPEGGEYSHLVPCTVCGERENHHSHLRKSGGHDYKAGNGQ